MSLWGVSHHERPNIYNKVQDSSTAQGQFSLNFRTRRAPREAGLVWGLTRWTRAAGALKASQPRLPSTLAREECEDSLPHCHRTCPSVQSCEPTQPWCHRGNKPFGSSVCPFYLSFRPPSLPPSLCWAKHLHPRSHTITPVWWLHPIPSPASLPPVPDGSLCTHLEIFFFFCMYVHHSCIWGLKGKQQTSSRYQHINVSKNTKSWLNSHSLRSAQPSQPLGRLTGTIHSTSMALRALRNCTSAPT